jgi:hypothetical protein
LKQESVEEYLARGGLVQRAEAVRPSFNQRINLNPKFHQTLMDLDEGAHYFSEIKEKKAKKTKKKELDVSALPKSLRKLVGK